MKKSMKNKTKQKTRTEHPRTVQQFQRYNRSVVETPEEEGNKGTEEISEVIITENFLKSQIPNHRPWKCRKQGEQM